MHETPQKEDDELELARKQKELEEIKGRLHESFAVLRSIARTQARLVMWTGAFSETDLHLMLRGQILSFQDREDWPCQHYGTDDDFEDPCHIEDPKEPWDRFQLIRERDQDQTGLRGPLDPVPAPRNHLQCPLVERALKGDATVPCHEAQGLLPEGTELPPPRTAAERVARRSLALIMKWRLTPCGIFHKLARDTLDDLVHAPPPAPPPPQEPGDASGDLSERRVRKHLRVFQEHERHAAYARAEGARAGLLFLQEARRLERWEGSGLLDHGAYVTDIGWLPCRDDPQRNLYFNRVHRSQDSDHFISERWLSTPEVRDICPMIERARLGDRTTPCCEALKEPPDPEWIDTDERGKEMERQKGNRVSVEQEAELDRRRPPRPQYWLGPDDQPGERADPVIVHGMRPCYLIGQLLARDLYPLAESLADLPPEEVEALLSDEESDEDLEDDEDDDDDLEEEDEDDDDG